MSKEWNHNIQYHDAALATVPQPCGHALDVGCGTGLFARRLALISEQVTGIDLDPEIVASASSAEPRRPNLTFVAGDIMRHPLPLGGFNYVGSIATLHHLPLQPALARFRELLAPGGALTIIGLYRPEGIRDALWEAAGFVASHAMRRVRRFTSIDAPTQEPSQTLASIRLAAAAELPGSRLRRELFFRYSLVWLKPHSTG